MAEKYQQEVPLDRDGKWLFIPVRDAQDLSDIQQLVLLKKRPEISML